MFPPKWVIYKGARPLVQSFPNTNLRNSSKVFGNTSNSQNGAHYFFPDTPTQAKTGIKRVSFLPVPMDNQYHTEVLKLKARNPRFDKIAQYMDWVSEGLPHRFTVDGDEVVVSH